MISSTYVLNYIKTKMGMPFVPLELIDEQILNWVRMETIPLFSWYLPYEASYTFNTSDPTVKTDKQTEFYISDPNGLPIIDIQRMFYNEGNYLIMDHPIMGVLSSNDRELQNFLRRTEQFGNSWKYSQFRYWFEFIKPNRIRIMPRNLAGHFTIQYETHHAPDFSTIPVEQQELFLTMAWADTVLMLARIREQFPNIETPFGQVSLNAESLKSEAGASREWVISQLENSNPSITVSIG